MTDRDLLTGIATHPAEVDRWLVLADWLEDHGDPRGELARLRYLLHIEPDHPEQPRRLARQLELLKSGLAPVVPTWTNECGMEFAVVLPGTFSMGSPTTEADHWDHEARHPVTLTQPFYLGVYPVTVGEFRCFVEATEYKTEAEQSDGAVGYVGRNWKGDPSITWRSPGFAQTDRHPVVCVSWNDAQALVAWLNKEESDLLYSLPTEAQWEYACRAGSATAYFWGDDPNKLGKYAWFAGNSGMRNHTVKTKKPNPWGLWHLHGLVWEWCADWYGRYPSGAVQDPVGVLSEDPERVFRGGSWDSDAGECRSAYRGVIDPSDRRSHRGFRLAASIRVSKG